MMYLCEKNVVSFFFSVFWLYKFFWLPVYEVMEAWIPLSKKNQKIIFIKDMEISGLLYLRFPFQKMGNVHPFLIE